MWQPLSSLNKGSLTSLVRIALSLLALAILFQQVGGRQVWQVLRDARAELLVAGWLLFLVGILIRALRWRVLLYGLGLRPSFWVLLKLYLIGGFFNTFLPSGFGGDVIRVLEIAQSQGDRAAALGTVLVDRMAGILALLALGLIVVPFVPGLPIGLALGFAAIACVGLLAGILVLDGRLLRRLSRWLPDRLSVSGRGKLALVYAAVTGSGAKAVVQALGLSLLFNLVNILVYWLCAQAVSIHLELSFYFVAVPLLSLSLLLPISVGGLGARDWVAQWLLAPMAIPNAATAAWTLGYWAVTAVAGLVGGLLYLAEGGRGLLQRV